MNPFTLKYDSRYFCDREEEIQYLKSNTINGLNTLVHSPRRLGKSALIKHLFHKFEKEKKYETIYIDLFATQSLKDFTKIFGEALLNKYHTKNLIIGIKKLFKGLHASLSFSTDGSPQLSLGLGEGQVETSLNQLFTCVNQRRKPVLVAFDEFQEIADYPEKAEAVLRSFIQHLNNVTFIFSGSSNHILQNMFYSAKQAFYQSTESLVLEKIDNIKYSDFIKNCFSSFNKNITDDSIDYILDFTETHTYYTQVLCNQVFYKSGYKLEVGETIEIAKNYIETRKLDYFSIFNLLPDNQKKIITAIAKEGAVRKPSAVDFLIKYKLPSSSSTLQALHSLTDKEMVYLTREGYKVYDVFFKRFLERYY